jgi:hypothetical protein
MGKRKITLLITILMLVAGAFSGCRAGTRKYVSQEYLKRHEDFSEEELGDIRTDGDYVGCNPDNMLKLKGIYTGLDFVTLVFDASSPVQPEQARRFADKHYNAYFQGVIYKNDLACKFVTYQYATIIHNNGIQMKTASKLAVQFYLNDEEPMSYYSVDFRGFKTSVKNSKMVEYDMYIVKRKQTGVINESYWTDYTYDEIAQYYSRDTGKWTQKETLDRRTNNMPLE